MQQKTNNDHVKQLKSIIKKQNEIINVYKEMLQTLAKKVSIDNKNALEIVIELEKMLMTTEFYKGDM